MTFAVSVSALLVILSTVIHHETLRFVNERLPRIRVVDRRSKVLVAVFGAMLSHAAQISMFAFAYFVLRDRMGLGVFGGKFSDVFSSFLYFSTETYTSLGFGDIYPLGQLRIVAGIESFTGLLMISWTASFTFLEMSRFWTGAERDRDRALP